MGIARPREPRLMPDVRGVPNDAVLLRPSDTPHPSHAERAGAPGDRDSHCASKTLTLGLELIATLGAWSGRASRGVPAEEAGRRKRSC